MLKSKPFKRKPPAWATEQKPAREYRMPVAHPDAFRNPVAITTAAEPIAKSDAVICEPYRRAVAGLRCIHCGVLGYSQCAHANTGKGVSIKVCDLQSFPLCTVHPDSDGTLVQGCHERFDQGALFSKLVRRDLEQAWIADTQRKIYIMGLWPKKLPYTDVVDAIIKEIRA